MRNQDGDMKFDSAELQSTVERSLRRSTADVGNLVGASRSARLDASQHVAKSASIRCVCREVFGRTSIGPWAARS